MTEHTNSHKKTVRKHSLYGHEEENNDIQRKNTLESGIAFSLGSKVLKGNSNENEQIKSLFVLNKNIKTKSTIISKDKISKDYAKSPRVRKRKLSKSNAKFRSEANLNQYTHKRKGSLYSKMHETEEDKLLKNIADI